MENEKIVIYPYIIPTQLLKPGECVSLIYTVGHTIYKNEPHRSQLQKDAGHNGASQGVN